MAESFVLFDGTRLSGFVTSEENQPPRECHNCIWYKQDSCHHPVVMIDPEVPGEPGEPKPVQPNWCCNGFQSPGKTLIFGLRHGTTEANEEGLHRGWMEVPLDGKGAKDAEEAAEFLKGKGVMKIYCSDLERAAETAKIVGDALEVPVVPDFSLRPINKGEFEGKSKEDTKEDFDWFVEHPSKEIPDGESIDEFNQRYGDALDRYICEAEESGPILLVTHNSNCIGARNHLSKAEDNADHEIIQPGGVFRISKKKDQLLFRAVFKSGEGQTGS